MGNRIYCDLPECVATSIACAMGFCECAGPGRRRDAVSMNGKGSLSSYFKGQPWMCALSK